MADGVDAMFHLLLSMPARESDRIHHIGPRRHCPLDKAGHRSRLQVESFVHGKIAALDVHAVPHADDVGIIVAVTAPSRAARLYHPFSGHGQEKSCQKRD